MEAELMSIRMCKNSLDHVCNNMLINKEVQIHILYKITKILARHSQCLIIVSDINF
jgi:hypothetical protein